MPPALIALDAADTLRHDESVFRMTGDRFAALLGDRAAPEAVSDRLLETERRNLALYGYGVKSFTHSMIGTADEIAEGDGPPAVACATLDFGRETLSRPVEPFEGAAETPETLARRRPPPLVTRGDLFDQARKPAQSGPGELFSGVEIVSEKDEATCARVFARHGSRPEAAPMAGDPPRPDVLPALAVGARAVHVPYAVPWVPERAEPPGDHSAFAGSLR